MSMEHTENNKRKVRQKISRVLFFVGGTVSLALGTIGVFIPILPTTPFLLLATACYLKSSSRMHKWLLNNKWFGEYIRNYKEGKGLSRRTKITTLSTLWITICVSMFSIVNLWMIQLFLFGIALGVSVHVIKLPTFRRK